MDIQEKFEKSDPPWPLSWLALARPLGVLDFVLKDTERPTADSRTVTYEAPLWVKQPDPRRTYLTVVLANWRPFGWLARGLWRLLGRP